jgi:hypothetical protein
MFSLCCSSIGFAPFLVSVSQHAFVLRRLAGRAGCLVVTEVSLVSGDGAARLAGRWTVLAGAGPVPGPPLTLIFGAAHGCDCSLVFVESRQHSGQRTSSAAIMLTFFVRLADAADADGVALSPGTRSLVAHAV